jgi:hypothetical protein
MAWWATLYRIERFSIRSGIGVVVLVALTVAGVLASPPVLRWPVLGTIAVGSIVGGAWIVWRSRRPIESPTLPLSLDRHEGRRRPR